MDSLLVPSRKPHVGRVTAFLFETYLLINRYWKGEYEGKPTVWLILAQYIVLAMVIAFAYIGVGASDIPKDLTDVAYHISALATIRLAITVNTVPVFVAAFKNPRVTDIRGRGDDHIKYSSTSVYFAKFFVLNFFRVLFFIPFTAIVYPIVTKYPV